MEPNDHLVLSFPQGRGIPERKPLPESWGELVGGEFAARLAEYTVLGLLDQGINAEIVDSESGPVLWITLNPDEGVGCVIPLKNFEYTYA